ncbi:hypothetical protein [Blastococcus atacamensis]|uniref:hypothetical protein n=1 Tax=Blastococcus atacamensis TaxID=2070508 RepID=UPI000CEC8E15|nr:hypothetical protein [Blastococcus atacamensis]
MSRWRIPQWLRGLRFDDVPVPVLLPEPLAGDVRALLAGGERIEAVRLVRQRTHLGIRSRWTRSGTATGRRSRVGQTSVTRTPACTL